MTDRRKTLRKSLRLCLFLMLLGLLCVIAEHLRGRHAFKSRLNSLRAAGEKLSVAEIKPPFPNPDQNVALGLLSLSNRISLMYSNVAEKLPPLMQYVSPGNASPSWKSDSWGTNGSKSWDLVQSALMTDPTLAGDLHEILKRPSFHSGFDYENGFSDFKLPGLHTFKTVTQIQSALASSRLRLGDLNGAIELLVDAADLVAKQKSERLMISQLVRIACGAIAGNATWGAMQAAGWNEAQLKRVQEVWQQIDYASDMASSIEMERNMTIDHFHQLRTSDEARERFIAERESMQLAMGLETGLGPTKRFILRRVHFPLWRACWVDQDALHALNLWQQIVEADRVARSKSWIGAQPNLNAIDEDARPWGSDDDAQKKITVYDRCRYLVSNEPFSVTSSLFKRTFMAETHRRMLVTAIALERYKLREKKWPQNLNALVPDFLPAIPIDCWNGEPLKYRVNNDETFTLYSVGEDGKDDQGGLTLVPEKKEYRQMWDSIDVVWPQAAK